jgi:penicillin-binding protein 2
MHWKEYMNKFGLGTRLGVDLPSEDMGSIPDTSVYNKEYRNSWNSCSNLTLGIGQDKMTATPLQLANAMCIIANKGYYYTPHFVEKIEGEVEKDGTLLNKYRMKHEVLTHISDMDYSSVIEGMHDVVTLGTARVAQIPGIDICAKTGTAENYTILDGNRIKLPNNSMFVCFAPKDNPRIAIAVAVQNAGFGATWAGPIARILMEKYLNDTLQTKSVEDLERIANTNLMPAYLKRLQYKTDSIRAQDWFKKTNDSSYIRRFIGFENKKAPVKKSQKENIPVKQEPLQAQAILQEKNYLPKPSPEVTTGAV